MKGLIALIVFCFLTVIFYFFGKWGFVVLLGLVLVTPFIVYNVLKSRRPPAPAAPVTPTKGYGWVGLIAILVVIGLIAGFVIPWRQQKQKEEARRAQPERYVFTWQMKPGQTNRQGQSVLTLEVRFTRRDSKNLRAELFDVNGQGVTQNVGGLHLSWVGADLIGEWMNYLDGDGGKCYLYKTGGDIWAGSIELKDGRSVNCRLEKKRD